MFDSFRQDLRYALRSLRINPGFAGVIILSLALGVGANTAFFSLIDALLLKKLPVSHPEELLQLTESGGDRESFSNPVWEQIRDRQDAFSGIFAYGRWAFNLAPGGEAHNVNGEYVSGQFFDTLGLRAVQGRTLTPADDRRGCAGALILTYGFWEREYGLRPDIVGRTISLNNHPFQIVGVTTRGFSGTEVGASLDFMLPLCAERIIHGDTTLLDADPAGRWLRIICRPRPGTSTVEASARLAALSPVVFRATVQSRWPSQDREQWLRTTLVARSAATGLSFLRENYRIALLVLLAISGMVLLIGCANVSNLLLARGAVRQREIAIRLALGSRRGRVVRQLLTESLLLSLFGAVLGALLAFGIANMLVKFLDASLDLTPDFRVLGFTAGVAVFTGLLFGLAPALRGWRVDLTLAGRTGSPAVAGGSMAGPVNLLVSGQVVLSMVLVAAAGLLLSSFLRLAWLDPGFEARRVLLAGINLRSNDYSPQRRAELFRRILESLRALPGVQAASLSDFTPMLWARRIESVSVEDHAALSRDDSQVYFNAVSDAYFATMGTPLLAGRDFDGHDIPASPPVAAINLTMAKKFFGGASAIGRRFRIRTGDKFGDPLEVIGVVKDAKYNDLRQEIPPTAFTSWNQSPSRFAFTNLEVRPAFGEPSALAASVSAAIGSIDRTVSIEFTTLAIQTNKTLEREQLLAMLAVFFGGLALLLAAAGLYGVMSYKVARRRREIGIRMALGADSRHVLTMVMKEVALVVGCGIAGGLAATVIVTRLISHFLYGVRPNDPLTLFITTVVLVSVAAAAAYWPARQASRIDPMTCLREE
jgi:predicted permease